MSHEAKIGALTDELITLIAFTTAASDPASFNARRENALRLFRQNKYSRTNQFEVYASLHGLEEKCRIFSEDRLADALQERTNKLASLQVKWAPEVLQLLLELSNQPLKNPKVDLVCSLLDPPAEPPTKLDWKQLVAEDPLLREKSVWRNVDFTAESSDDDECQDTRSLSSEATDSTTRSSLEDDPRRFVAGYIQRSDEDDGLVSLRRAQTWREAPSAHGIKLETAKKHISELQAIREVLFMLSGLPTSIYEVQLDRSLIKPSKLYTLRHCSTEAFQKVSKWFADQGSAILALRSWAKQSQTEPLLQIFQEALLARIQDLDVDLIDLQRMYIAPKAAVVVSLLQVQFRVMESTAPLIRLHEMIKRLDVDRCLHSFRYLELLYEETCAAHSAGHNKLFTFMGQIFFKCLQVYLHPIRKWMEEGELEAGDSVFFVREVSRDVGPAAIWQARYRIRQTQDGALHAPKFLHTSAQKIFTTGKSVVILKQLQKCSLLEASRCSEPLLDFETICETDRIPLAPFPALFDAAFDVWIQSKHRQTSEILREILFESCGLHKSLDALAHIFLQADGSATALFSNSIFDKLDTLDTSWSDRFTLTELAQSTFGAHTSIISDRLQCQVITDYNNTSLKLPRKSVDTLAIISIKYQLSWPIRIILDSSTMLTYDRIFTFLLQIRRSSHILKRHRLLLLTSQDSRRYCRLRSCLLWFTSTLQHYLTSLVLEPATIQLRQALRAAEDVDSMIKVHAHFSKTALDQTLLSSKLELIHETILTVLDWAIELQDRQAIAEARRKEALHKQRVLGDLAEASLGLVTPRLKTHSQSNAIEDPQRGNVKYEAWDDEKLVEVPLGTSSSPDDDPIAMRSEETGYVSMLERMEADFERNVSFIAGALKGIARAGGSESQSRTLEAIGDTASAAKWDILGDLLEEGLSFKRERGLDS